MMQDIVILVLQSSLMLAATTSPVRLMPWSPPVPREMVEEGLATRCRCHLQAGAYPRRAFLRQCSTRPMIVHHLRSSCGRLHGYNIALML